MSRSVKVAGLVLLVLGTLFAFVGIAATTVLFSDVPRDQTILIIAFYLGLGGIHIGAGIGTARGNTRGRVAGAVVSGLGIVAGGFLVLVSPLVGVPVVMLYGLIFAVLGAPESRR